MDNDMGGKSWHQPPPRDNRNCIQTRPLDLSHNSVHLQIPFDHWQCADYFFYPENPRLPTRVNNIMLAIYRLQFDNPQLFLPPPHPFIPQTEHSDTERRTPADTSDLYADHDQNENRSTTTTGSPVASTSRMMSADVAPPVTHTLTSGEAADIKPSKQPCKDKVDASIQTQGSSYSEIHGQSAFQAVTVDASPAGPPCLHVPVKPQAQATPNVQGVVDAQTQAADHHAASHTAAHHAAHRAATQATAYHAAHHAVTQAAAHHAAHHPATHAAAHHIAHHAATQAAAHYPATQAAVHQAAAKAHAHYQAQLSRAQAQTQILEPQGATPGTFLTAVPPPNCPACRHGQPCHFPRPVPDCGPSRSDPPPFVDWNIPSLGYMPGQHAYEVTQGYSRGPQITDYGSGYNGGTNRCYEHSRLPSSHLYDTHRDQRRNLEVLTRGPGDFPRRGEPLNQHNIFPGHHTHSRRSMPPIQNPQFQPTGHRGNRTSPLSSQSYESDFEGTEGPIDPGYLSPHHDIPLPPRNRHTSQSSHGYESEPPHMTRSRPHVNFDEMPLNENTFDRHGTMPTHRPTPVVQPWKEDYSFAGYAPAPPALQTQSAMHLRSDPTLPERAVFQPLPALEALHSVPETTAFEGFRVPEARSARRPRSTAHAPAAHLASPAPTALPLSASVPTRPIFRPAPPPPTTWRNVTYSQDPSQFLSSRADYLPAPSRVDNTENIPVVSANCDLKIPKTATPDGRSLTRNNKPASRSARPSAPINFAPPPVTTADTRNTNRPRYYSEVTRGVPLRTQAQVAPGTGTNNQYIPTVSALSNDPWPYRNMLIPRGSATSKVNNHPETIEIDTTKGNRFGAVGDGKPKKNDKRG